VFLSSSELFVLKDSKRTLRVLIGDKKKVLPIPNILNLGGVNFSKNEGSLGSTNSFTLGRLKLDAVECYLWEKIWSD